MQVDGIDICAVKAESQYELPEIFWAPTADEERFGINKPAIMEEFHDRMQSAGGRAVDTSMWCK